MKRSQDRNNCESCLLINPRKPKERREEGIIKMDEFWSLNHYNGPEGFLGWLALSPIKHKELLTDLNDKEAAILGINIRNVEKALRQYWSREFPNDPLLKIYPICFSESKDYHLHFHSIPRTKSFSRSFSTCKPAWETPKMTICWDEFPEEYRIRCREKAVMGKSEVENIKAVKNLIVFIKQYLKKEWLIAPTKVTVG